MVGFFRICLLAAAVLPLNSIHASNMSLSCADAYGDYFLEGDQVFGRSSEVYFPIEIIQTVLISKETDKCTNKAGDVFEAFAEQSVVRVKGTPTAETGEIEISFLCETVGDSYPNMEGVDTECVSTATVLQGPFTER